MVLSGSKNETLSILCVRDFSCAVRTQFCLCCACEILLCDRFSCGVCVRFCLWCVREILLILMLCVRDFTCDVCARFCLWFPCEILLMLCVREFAYAVRVHTRFWYYWSWIYLIKILLVLRLKYPIDLSDDIFVICHCYSSMNIIYYLFYYYTIRNVGSQPECSYYIRDGKK